MKGGLGRLEQGLYRSTLKSRVLPSAKSNWYGAQGGYAAAPLTTGYYMQFTYNCNILGVGINVSVLSDYHE